MGFWAVAAPIIGGALSLLGGKSQEKAAKQASNDAWAVRNALQSYWLSDYRWDQLQRMMTPNLRTPGAGKRVANAGWLAGARAEGGGVKQGESYLVGEEGPEVFTPSTSGLVSPTKSPSAPPANPTGQAATSNSYTSKTVQPVVQPKEAADLASGDLVSSWINYFLGNPGKLSPAAYNRDQEQLNLGQTAATQQMMGSLTGRGVDPNSGLGQMLLQGVMNTSANRRVEAGRDYSMQQESLGRQDVAQAMQSYMALMQMISQIQAQQAGIYAGVAIPQVPVTAGGYGALGNYLGMLMSSGYFNQGGGNSALGGTGYNLGNGKVGQ